MSSHSGSVTLALIYSLQINLLPFVFINVVIIVFLILIIFITKLNTRPFISIELNVRFFGEINSLYFKCPINPFRFSIFINAPSIKIIIGISPHVLTRILYFCNVEFVVSPVRISISDKKYLVFYS